MLSDSDIRIIKSTIPVLEQAGPSLTKHFYQRMFTHHPEVQHIFNASHQASGRQQIALFEAIAAYAKNIENLAALTQAVERIAQKHTSFNIQPQHYDIVGEHLLATLRELAADAFTPEVEQAWAKAYLFLAQIFIDREGELYRLRAAAQGGWQGLRPFTVTAKRVESQLVTSFELTPADGGEVIDFLPGQYIGIEVAIPGSAFRQVRQYSLSCHPNRHHYRISVKREPGSTEHAGGLVSHYLHQQVKQGDEVMLYPPAGDFYLHERQQPVVLISAGVGLTPMQAMLEHLARQQYSQPVTYLHACDNPRQHSFSEQVSELLLPHWQQVVWYENPDKQLTADKPPTHLHKQGRMDLTSIKNMLPIKTGDFYLCGPVSFMQHVVQQLQTLGVNKANIHYEVFGPHEQF
ncbi:NO-inducible flavohemoprotein [Motilimonas pumila]|uniref:Flavohemoprotein n=1 Tax=Motilimonas pumila TaxID=2303987 RepID=A0A418YC96_9GAMM|nr:NO-inducible flavohemoprotein [Motilimonas pumila]RJG42113.1 NO-inducible flavohemoprotein [Motilimonas pumila]